MFHCFGLFFVLALSLHAQTLDEILTHSLKNHNSLKTIEQRLKGFDDSLALSRKFANPELSLVVNDIQFDDPTNRSIEPMQFEAVNFKQKIPYFGKRDAASKLINSQKELVLSSLDEAKVELIRSIKVTAYRIFEKEQQLGIVDEYLELLKSNIELSGVYGSSMSGDSWHEEMSNIQLTFIDLKIKRATIKSTRASLYSQLSYLSSMEIKSLELKTEISKPMAFSSYSKNLVNNASFKTKAVDVKTKNMMAKVKELDEVLDPYVKLGYYHRTAFEDYISISVGSALPVYGRESLSTQKARKDVLESQIKQSDFKAKLEALLKTQYIKLQNSYEVYKIINDESILELEHAFELSVTRVKSGKKMLGFTKLLEKKLKLYEKKYKAQASYNIAKTNMEALIGEIQ